MCVCVCTMRVGLFLSVCKGEVETVCAVGRAGHVFDAKVSQGRYGAADGEMECHAVMPINPRPWAAEVPVQPHTVRRRRSASHHHPSSPLTSSTQTHSVLQTSSILLYQIQTALFHTDPSSLIHSPIPLSSSPSLSLSIWVESVLV